MLSLVEISCLDLYRLDNINLDALTENFGFEFYFHYLSNWPDLCVCYMTQNGLIAGYIIGKIENKSTRYGHISALSVDPEFRREGLARKLMDYFENRCFKNYSTTYVDLFVRTANETAINLYKSLSYKIHKKIPTHHSDIGDMFLMKKYP